MRFTAALLSALAAPALADIKAVLLAGSSSYGNYRHQADVAHAYKILRQRGVPAENIITMMVDDVAGSSENPFPGKLYNKAGENPEEVYEGIQIDYKGDEINPDVYLAVLRGDVAKLKTLTKQANPRALQSDESDYVFLNFADHGGTDIIECGSGLVHSSDLVDAVQAIKNKQLLFYMEACESGSMFDGKLDDAGSIFAVTAANDAESSWGTYCPPQDKVTIDGKETELNTCLGDLFSVNWMQDTDAIEDLSKETVAQEVADVTKQTNKSHVQQFGNQAVASDPLSLFLGKATLGADDAARAAAALKKLPGQGSVPTRDIEFHLAYYAWLRSPADSAQRAAAWARLQAVEKRRDAIHARQEALHRQLCGDDAECHQQLHAPGSARDVVDCHKALIAEYAAGCKDLTGYALKLSKSLANMCGVAAAGRPARSVEELRAMVAGVCAPEVVV